MIRTHEVFISNFPVKNFFASLIGKLQYFTYKVLWGSSNFLTKRIFA